MVFSLCVMILLLPGHLAAESDGRNPGFDEAVEWLVANSSHEEFRERLSQVLGLAADVASLERVAREVVPLIEDRRLLADVGGRLGRFAMMIRDFELADELFESAYIASGGTDLESLYAQAQALLQIGRIAAAEQRARTVVAEAEDYELKRRAYAMVARTMHLRGRNEDAARLLDTLSELDDPDHVEPDTLLLQSAVLVSLERSGEEPLRRLERLHPQSVAVRMVGGRLVGEAPLPATMLTGPRHVPTVESDRGEAAGASASDSGENGDARPQTPRVTAIQVGSFSDRDNAVHLAADLRALGLEARIETVHRDGRSLELVLVSVPRGTTEEAALVLMALEGAGYRGFPIY